jgi:hypothetical protein
MGGDRTAFVVVVGRGVRRVAEGSGLPLQLFFPLILPADSSLFLTCDVKRRVRAFV